MFQPTVNVLEIVARTLVVYFTVVLGLRAFGKRELGQMTPFDLVLLLTDGIVEARDPHFDAAHIRRILEEAGAERIDEVPG